ncbi:antibiotic biosynthesis monooxygenase [Pseudomonas sp. SWRI74]|uniref:Antibiotic biosynthesis monooxygenase n=1 Tax=Pseudomonas azerbaijanoccidentalis TaxID=2842347 RepID=A0ABS6QQJ8_9PSED|nr:putative quinol monooxygenase [Pseudomonas azerbaijanoccidentalis]MBV4521190.1 antibiotic biosynthesis monooxygenase [Pseudomonas azerbaijanoccidentalis]
MNHEIRVVAVLLAREGKEDQVEQILRACIQPSRAEAGCLAYTLHRSIDQPGQFVFFERWSSREAIDLHRQMHHYKTLSDALIDMLIDRKVLLLEEIPNSPESLSSSGNMS